MRMSFLPALLVLPVAFVGAACVADTPDEPVEATVADEETLVVRLDITGMT